MKKAITLVWRALAVAVLVVVAGVAFVILAPDKLVWAAKIREGNKLVAKVESYRNQQGRLPESLDDLGIGVSESDRYFYEKCDDNQYRVWFGTTLGKSMTYSSESRDWIDLNVVCNREIDPPAK